MGPLATRHLRGTLIPRVSEESEHACPLVFPIPLVLCPPSPSSTGDPDSILMDMELNLYVILGHTMYYMYIPTTYYLFFYF